MHEISEAYPRGSTLLGAPHRMVTQHGPVPKRPRKLRREFPQPAAPPASTVKPPSSAHSQAGEAGLTGERLDLVGALRSYHLFQEARGDSLTHRRECARILAAFQGFLGDESLPAIGREDLTDFLVSVRKRPGLKGRKHVSESTVFAYHRTLAAFFRYLEGQGLLQRSPMRGVPKPRIDQTLIRPFTDEQVKRLLEQPDTSTFTGLRDATLMCLLLDTGLRVSECLGLTLADLDLEARTARVMGKGRRERQVPFSPVTLAWLKKYLERRGQDLGAPYVFVNQYGEQWTRNAVSHRVAQYGRRAGLRGVRVSPHTFRHTFGVNWIRGVGEFKGDEISLQQVLGHSDPTMTRRYVSLARQDLHQLHARLSPAARLVPSPPAKRQRLR